MNRSERRRANKKTKDSLKGSKDISIEMENIYFEWLKFSNLTEEQFLQNAEIRTFGIKKIMEGEIETVVIGSEYSNGFSIIGQPLISSSKEENENFELNVTLLLFVMATRLDNAYVNNAKYPERIKMGCDYYYNQVKSFVNENFKKM